VTNPVVPPLPDVAAMVPHSPWIAASPGLRECAELWLSKAPPHRAKLTRDAHRLARPTMRWESIRALGKAGGRVVSAVGISGLADILETATEARRRRADGSASDERTGRTNSPSAVESAQRLVAAGGPAYVKLGQFIATAKGILPDEWVEAFEWCRDEVPPLEPGTAEKIIERTFGSPPSVLFASFEREPMAAASIAQVHRATLHDGTAVVVKVRRPGLRRKFIEDIRVMALLSGFAERFVAEARMANLTGFVELFAQIVLEELDFRLEAVNIIESALASESAGHDYVSYPRPVPDLVASNVLVMEHVSGVRYTDALKAYPGKVDGDRLLRLAIQSVLEQTLIFGLFHGDLHAGNVLIDSEGDFALVDFGIVGRLSAEQRAALIRFMIGFARSDMRIQLSAMREFGAVPESADFERLVAEIQVHATQAMMTEIRAGEMSKGFEEMAEALSVIIQLLSRSGFVVPKELVLFFKNILYLNGFAAALAPGVNLLAEIEPVFTYFATKYPEAIDMMARFD
jgi:ubiquinone biosynthesis protein